MLQYWTKILKKLKIWFWTGKILNHPRSFYVVFTSPKNVKEGSTDDRWYNFETLTQKHETFLEHVQKNNLFKKDFLVDFDDFYSMIKTCCSYEVLTSLSENRTEKFFW